MKTFALTVNLQDDPARIQQYKIEHTRVWPEVLAQIRRVGIQQMKIWQIGNQLFMYLEADDDFDPVAGFAKIRQDPKSVEWNEWMAREFQTASPHAKAGEWWAPMELAFDLRGALGELTS